MPSARPLPKKFLTSIRQSLEDLNTIAEKAKFTKESIYEDASSSPIVRTALHDIEVMAYRVALELSQMKVATSCENCPSAPATTHVHAYLYALANRLKECTDEVFSVLEDPTSLNRHNVDVVTNDNLK